MRKVQTILRFAASALFLVALSGCWIPSQISFREVTAKLDPKLTDIERKVLEQDIRRFLDIDVELPTSSMAALTFGGENLDAVAGFLNARIQYVMSSSTSMDDHVFIGKLKSSAAAMTGASNVGTSLFYESVTLYLQSGSVTAFKDFEGHITPVKSTRVGIMQLGDLYKHAEFIGNADRSVERMGILIHEARHSDCTGGLKQGDFDALKRGVLPQSKSCGHMHIACPAGALAGLYACEAHPWGAYFTGAMFNGAIAKTCVGCSEAEKQVGTLSAMDSLARIHPAVLKAMTTGSLGAPDMSHMEVFSAR